MNKEKFKPRSLDATQINSNECLIRDKHVEKRIQISSDATNNLFQYNISSSGNMGFDNKIIQSNLQGEPNLDQCVQNQLEEQKQIKTQHEEQSQQEEIISLYIDPETAEKIKKQYETTILIQKCSMRSMQNILLPKTNAREFDQRINSIMTQQAITEQNKYKHVFNGEPKSILHQTVISSNITETIIARSSNQQIFLYNVENNKGIAKINIYISIYQSIHYYENDILCMDLAKSIFDAMKFLAKKCNFYNIPTLKELVPLKEYNMIFNEKKISLDGIISEKALDKKIQFYQSILPFTKNRIQNVIIENPINQICMADNKRLGIICVRIQDDQMIEKDRIHQFFLIIFNTDTKNQKQANEYQVIYIESIMIQDSISASIQDVIKASKLYKNTEATQKNLRCNSLSEYIDYQKQHTIYGNILPINFVAYIAGTGAVFAQNDKSIYCEGYYNKNQALAQNLTSMVYTAFIMSNETVQGIIKKYQEIRALFHPCQLLGNQVDSSLERLKTAITEMLGFYFEHYKNQWQDKKQDKYQYAGLYNQHTNACQKFWILANLYLGLMAAKDDPGGQNMSLISEIGDIITRSNSQISNKINSNQYLSDGAKIINKCLKKILSQLTNAKNKLDILDEIHKILVGIASIICEKDTALLNSIKAVTSENLLTPDNRAILLNDVKQSMFSNIDKLRLTEVGLLSLFHKIHQCITNHEYINQEYYNISIQNITNKPEQSSSLMEKATKTLFQNIIFPLDFCDGQPADTKVFDFRGGDVTKQLLKFVISTSEKINALNTERINELNAKKDKNSIMINFYFSTCSRSSAYIGSVIELMNLLINHQAAYHLVLYDPTLGEYDVSTLVKYTADSVDESPILPHNVLTNYVVLNTSSHRRNNPGYLDNLVFKFMKQIFPVLSNCWQKRQTIVYDGQHSHFETNTYTDTCYGDEGFPIRISEGFFLKKLYLALGRNISCSSNLIQLLKHAKEELFFLNYAVPPNVFRNVIKINNDLGVFYKNFAQKSYQMPIKEQCIRFNSTIEKHANDILQNSTHKELMQATLKILSYMLQINIASNIYSIQNYTSQNNKSLFINIDKNINNKYLPIVKNLLLNLINNDKSSIQINTDREKMPIKENKFMLICSNPKKKSSNQYSIRYVINQAYYYYPDNTKLCINGKEYNLPKMFDINTFIADFNLIELIPHKEIGHLHKQELASCTEIINDLNDMQLIPNITINNRSTDAEINIVNLAINKKITCELLNIVNLASIINFYFQEMLIEINNQVKIIDKTLSDPQIKLLKTPKLLKNLKYSLLSIAQFAMDGIKNFEHNFEMPNIMPDQIFDETQSATSLNKSENNLSEENKN